MNDYEVKDGTLNMSPNKTVEAIWTSYDWDQVLEIADMLLARLTSRDERAA